MPYADPAKAAAYLRSWSERNRDKTRRYAAAWRKKNADAVLLLNRERARERVAREGTAHVMLSHAKRRAAARGVPCTITLDDIVIPTHCPVLGIELRKGTRVVGNNSPTLDCVIPSRGYVPGNVCVISYRANRLKSSASPAELRALVAYVERFSL